MNSRIKTSVKVVEELVLLLVNWYKRNDMNLEK